MSWFKLDDSLREHPKWIGLSLHARALWVDAGMWCAKNNNDGVIPVNAMPLIAFSAKIEPEHLGGAIKDLVAVRLWRQRPKSAGYGWLFHDWEKYQPLKQQVQRKAEQKSKHNWLHKTAAGKAVKARIERRDGVWCRYCGIEFNMSDGDRKGPTRRTHDFIDPEMQVPHGPRPSQEALDGVVAGIVLACGYCNATKGERTPDEAGMVLRAPPGAVSRDLSRSVRERIAGQPRSVRGVGTGRDGSDRIGSDRDGSAGDGQAPSTGSETVAATVAATLGVVS